MNINDKCIFISSKGEVECVILDKIVKMGASIQNDAYQTMDYSLNTYYKIHFNDKEIWVTGNFIKKIN